MCELEIIYLDLFLSINIMGSDKPDFYNNYNPPMMPFNHLSQSISQLNYQKYFNINFNSEILNISLLMGLGNCKIHYTQFHCI